MIPVGVEMLLTTGDALVAARHVQRRLAAGDHELMTAAELRRVAGVANRVASWATQIADVCNAYAHTKEPTR